MKTMLKLKTMQIEDSVPVLAVSGSSKSKYESKSAPSQGLATAKFKRDDPIRSAVLAVNADDLMALQMFLWRLDVEAVTDLVEGVNNILIQHVDLEYQKWID